MNSLGQHTSSSTIFSWWDTYKGEVMTGLFLLQLLVVYGLIQLFITGGFVPVTSLDYAIPTVPSFLVAYCLYYLILPLPFWSAYQQDDGQKSLFVVATTFFVAATICNTIFVLFPTEIIRPTVDGTGFFAQSLRLLHAVDGTVALLPSGHVTYSLVAALTTMHFNRNWGIIIWLSAFLIMPATVLIKQHYILDILGGIIVALFSYYAVFRLLSSRFTTES